MEVKPFLKWAGGKKQLLPEIRKYYPFNLNITKYAEPFVGGGAVLFDILNMYHLKEVYISDTNTKLINTYCIIREHLSELIVILENLQSEYLNRHSEDRKAYYLEKRSTFNKRETGDIESAALMIFLNRTCFNGLYRVNKTGDFNVPSGSYKMPLICDTDNLRLVSHALQDVDIAAKDYSQSEQFIDEQTFVYFDPPYRPISDTSNFTAYTSYVFDDKQQKELADFAHSMNERGAKILISNSDPCNADDEDNFFDELYRDFYIRRVRANRMINCNAKSRGAISELLISNFREDL